MFYNFISRCIFVMSDRYFQLSNDVIEHSFIVPIKNGAIYGALLTYCNYICVFTRWQTTWVFITLMDDNVENTLNH